MREYIKKYSKNKWERIMNQFYSYKDEEEDTQDEWNENPIENKKRAEIGWSKK